MRDNKPAFIREGGEVSGMVGKNHYLVFYESYKTWFIQNDKWFLEGRAGGYFSNQSIGKYVMSCFCSNIPKAYWQ